VPNQREISSVISQFVRQLAISPTLDPKIRQVAIDSIREQNPDINFVIELALRVLNTDLPLDERIFALKTLTRIRNRV